VCVYVCVCVYLRLGYQEPDPFAHNARAPALDGLYVRVLFVCGGVLV
jgi:hypothetical protein